MKKLGAILLGGLLILGCEKPSGALAAPAAPAPPRSAESLERVLALCPDAEGAMVTVFDYPTTRETREVARRNVAGMGLGDIDSRIRKPLDLGVDQIQRVVHITLEGEKNARGAFCRVTLAEAELKSRIALKGSKDFAVAAGMLVAAFDGEGTLSRLVLAAEGKNSLVEKSAQVRGFVHHVQEAPNAFLIATGKSVRKGLRSDPMPVVTLMRTDYPAVEMLAGFASEADAERALPSIKTSLAPMSASPEVVRTQDSVRVRLAMAKDSPLLVQETKRDLRRLSSALERYRQEKGEYPTTEQGLLALEKGSYLEDLLGQVPRDVWGAEYQYLFPHPKKPATYVLRSAGVDGEMDTLDDVFAAEADRPLPPQKKSDPPAPSPPPPPPSQAPVIDKPAPEETPRALKPVPLEKKVRLMVTASSWRDRPFDIASDLKPRLAFSGVEVVTDPGTKVDAVLEIDLSESKGKGVRGTGLKGTHVTDFELKMVLRRVEGGKSDLELKVEVSPEGQITDRSLYDWSLSILKKHAIYQYADRFVAAELRIRESGARLTEALLPRDSCEQAAALLKKMGFKGTTPRELALLAIGEGDWDACVKIGDAAIDPLLDRRQDNMPDDDADALYAIARMTSPRARETAIREFIQSVPHAFIFSPGPELIRRMGEIGDASCLKRLEEMVKEYEDDDPAKAVRAAIKALQAKGIGK